jgi:hypothetical protein
MASEFDTPKEFELLFPLIDYLRMASENPTVEPEDKNALLAVVKEALNRWDGPVQTNKTEAGKVLFALDAATQEWAIAGVNLSMWRAWKVLRFSPQVAHEWEKLGVTVDRAVFYRDLEISPAMFSRWATKHTTSEGDKYQTVEALVSFVKNSEVLTCRSADNWVKRDISIWEAEKWVKAGYTPAKAEAAITKGLSVEDVAGEALIPGASWSKVSKLMNKHGWRLDSITKNRYRFNLVWKKNTRDINMSFSLAGRLSSFYMYEGGSHVWMKTREYGYRGIAALTRLIEAEDRGEIKSS